jgi:penicillin-binding protein 1B
VWPFVVVFLLFAAGLSGVTFFLTDRLVAQRLAARRTTAIPAVYSDVLRIVPKPIGPERLRSQLAARRYREVPHRPENEGEFSLTGGVLEISTREYVPPSGRPVHPQKIRFDLASGEMRTFGGESIDKIVLEPQVVSHLGGKALRASSYKSLAAIPDSLERAIVAIEDERFYKHLGVDPIGIARAMWVNLQALAFVQGGSTLTQQFAKNFLLSPRRTLGRKLSEFFAALSLERRLTKDQILELYLNEVYFGQEGAIAIHGVAEAANSFFGKKIEDISLSEAALLAGLVQAPSYYAPRKHPQRATERRNIVLNKMLELRFISPEEHARAVITPLTIVSETSYRQVAPHFMAALRSDLTGEFGDENPLGEMTVHTGIDLDYQRCAEDAVSRGLAGIEKQFPRLTKKGRPLEAALVSLEPFSGKVRAWVGGRDFQKNQFNHVSQAVRQIGSTIKPFLYLTALDSGLNSYKVATPISVLSDRPVQVSLVTKDTWEPENYDRDYHGDVTLRYALEHSLNLPAVYVSQRVTTAALARTARAFRLADDIQSVPALALGAADTTLLKLTSAYGALANGGVYVAPRLFTSAIDNGGEVVAANPITEERIADEAAVFVLNNILQGVVERGTGRPVRNVGFRGTAAGKTGTSNDTRDAWFVGFAPDLVTGVWLGFDDNRPTGFTGGRTAAPIWGEYMKCLEPMRDDEKFIAPPGVVFVKVDGRTGGRASANCPPSETVHEVFVRGTEPKRFCPVHGGDDEEVPPSVEETHPERPRRRGLWETLFGG